MVASHAHNVFRGRLGEPSVNILEGFEIMALKAAKIAAVDQNVAIRDRYLTMPSMRIRDDAKGCHLLGDSTGIEIGRKRRGGGWHEERAHGVRVALLRIQGQGISPSESPEWQNNSSIPAVPLLPECAQRVSADFIETTILDTTSRLRVPDIP